ncbi:hypothetical protein PIB30_059270 [Stylosanthes scabra]|uniref:AB hydrolase-1 domain-containing protein n=1 Tax=Stylosanthes scabra TaxID=79078 RepID=A0ABU6ZIZ2_9FABA|nr:hypothetical protein [Stylosanthes scabra]
MNTIRSRWLSRKMAEEFGKSATATTSSAETTRRFWPSLLRWIPSSTDHIINAEKRLLSLVKTPYVQEKVDIGTGPPDSRVRWFRSVSNEPRVVAIDQLGWGGSSRPDFTCRSTEETEAWFIDSFEEWRKAKNLSNFVLLGHSFGGYVASKYALKHPEHVKHLILVGPAGFSQETERITKFLSTWKGSLLNQIWESNFTPQTIIRGLGPWGPDMVRRYTSARFVTHTTGETLNESEASLLTDYVYHTLAAKASGELCLKHIFSFGAFAKLPLLHRASEWKVPTTFIYGVQDWMNYEGAQEARDQMKVPCEIIRVPQAGHFVFIDNPSGFHSAVFYACRRFLSPDPDGESLPEGLTSA